MLRLCLRSRVRHFLHELPDSLDETYERILKGFIKQTADYVQRLLQCLAVAIRPLLVEELAGILTLTLIRLRGRFRLSMRIGVRRIKNKSFSLRVQA
jgi:hypothetical protein